MPDHLHHYKAASDGRSSYDSPLSLVVGHPSHMKNQGSSPGRSSGYSEGSSEDAYSRQRLTSSDDGADIPLSLVVREIGESSDSGHEEDHRPLLGEEDVPDVTIAKVNDDGEKAGIKIKDFAKLLLDKGTSESASACGKELNFPCEFCERLFINKYHLQSHLVTHTGERSFECRKCAKSFGRKSTLRAHMTTHTKVSNFMCPLCDKACNDNNSLEEHIRMHTGEKPFVCSICSKSYARKSHLNVHYRVHTGERPFVCLNCRKDFTEKRFLNDHIQTAHSGQDGPLKCPNCFREFAYKTSLKQHLKKQMCVKNLNRSGSLLGGAGVAAPLPTIAAPLVAPPAAAAVPTAQGSQPHSKQFSCPFCEKSYSWKQTLKQHVSMYHRNKVHTDEFWKYELTKHRRAVVDSKTNEDMWKKQLGKHGSEQKPPEISEMWLEQINLQQQQAQSGVSVSPSKSSVVSTEMKLLALQSLQSSLKLMKMEGCISSKNKNPHQTPELHPPEKDSGGGYLSLLAHISSAQNPAEDDERSPALPEEPAAKRTQMWLAQLGRYRQKSVQYEIEKNHEELWEEQIAKIKNNPVKSPLEPLEITIEDDDDDEKEHEDKVEKEPGQESSFVALNEEANIKEEVHLQLQQEPPASPPASPRGPIPPVTTKMVPLMSALEVTAHPAAKNEPTISNEDSGSVLKSLLLDRFGRKRPAQEPCPLPPKATPPQLEEATDILRRRLLGLREEGSKQILVLDVDAINNNTNDSGNVDEERKSAETIAIPEEKDIKSTRPTTPTPTPQPKPQRKDSYYARTSVLKHLLHRYTESHSME